MSVAERIKYYQVDERMNYHCRCSNDKQDLNHLSDSKNSSDASQITEIWNDNDEEIQVLFLLLNLLISFLIFL